MKSEGRHEIVERTGDVTLEHWSSRVINLRGWRAHRTNAVSRDQCPTALPVLVVHDEIVVEVPAVDSEQAKAWLKESIRYGMRQFLHQVPVEVEAKVAADGSSK